MKPGGCWDFRLLSDAGNSVITVVVFNHGIRKRCDKHTAIKDALLPDGLWQREKANNKGSSATENAKYCCFMKW